MRVIHLPSGRKGEVVQEQEMLWHDLWAVKWDGADWTSKVDADELRELNDASNT
jgi:hypothetical protein